MKKRVAILDYGVGNLFSLRCAIEREGAEVAVVKSISSRRSVDALILPGVGSFSPASKILADVKGPLLELLDRGTPVLGICLGMQLFFEESEEGGGGEGLSLCRGRVVRLPKGVKVPHMGWNTLRKVREDRIMQGVEDGAWVYFVHSYYPKAEAKETVVAESTYGATFPAIISKGNLYGTQFHPEKSGEVGVKMLRNFLTI